MAEAAASPNRIAGIVSMTSAAAAIVLLANHPNPGPVHGFADILKAEAADRIIGGIVHGGFIVVLAVQLACYAILNMRYRDRASATAALTLFAVGVAFQSASLVLDGLVIPTIAMRYLAAPAKLEYAKALFVLLGTIVSFIMPIGLMFQAAGIAFWGWTLTASGSRTIGLIALLLGSLLLAALIVGFLTMNPIILMIAIAGTAAWAVIAGLTLFGRATS